MRAPAIVVASLTSLALIGCATTTPMKDDWSGVEAKVATAEKGDFGTCAKAKAQLVASLGEAKRRLKLAQKEGYYSSEEDFKRADAAADEAVEARRIAEKACKR